jgi:hypothetical protein
MIVSNKKITRPKMENNSFDTKEKIVVLHLNPIIKWMLKKGR